MTETWDKRFAELFPDDVIQQIADICQHISTEAGESFTAQDLIIDLVADEHYRLFGDDLANNEDAFVADTIALEDELFGA